MKTFTEYELEESRMNQFDGAMRKKIRAIAKMTDRNDHMAAAIEGARMLKNKKLEKIFLSLRDIVSLEGYIPSELSAYRTNMLNVLWDEGRKKLPPELADEFYGAF